jgi:hypothetical protein
MQTLKQQAIAVVGTILIGGLGAGSAAAADIPAQPAPPPYYGEYGPAPVEPAYPYPPPPAAYGYPPPVVYYDYPPPVVVAPGPYYRYGYGYRYYPRYFARGYGHHRHY